MYYYFTPYEQDFRAWWDSKTFPETSPLTRDFLQHITRPDCGNLPVADENGRRIPAPKAVRWSLCWAASNSKLF